VDSEPEDGLDGAQEYVWGTNVNVPDVSRAIHRFLSNYRSSSDDVDAKYVQLIEQVGGLCPILDRTQHSNFQSSNRLHLETLDRFLQDFRLLLKALISVWWHVQSRWWRERMIL
jgi:hypothetical protein